MVSYIIHYIIPANPNVVKGHKWHSWHPQTTHRWYDICVLAEFCILLTFVFSFIHWMINTRQFQHHPCQKPLLGEQPSAHINYLCQLKLGHTYLTHSYLLKEEPPECDTCQCRLTANHILVDCLEFDHIRPL